MFCKLLSRLAGTTGLEPATSAVTGQRSNQLNYVPNRGRMQSLEQGLALFKIHSSTVVQQRKNSGEPALHGVHDFRRVQLL
jgi:hypothetical protein